MQLLAASYLHYGRAGGKEDQAQSQLRTPPPGRNAARRRRPRPAQLQRRTPTHTSPGLFREVSKALASSPGSQALLSQPPIRSRQNHSGASKVGMRNADWGGVQCAKMPQSSWTQEGCERLQGRTWRGGADSYLLRDARCVFTIPCTSLITSPLAAPAAPEAGEHLLRGTWSAGPGARSGPRCPFKGFPKLSLWYQMSLVTSVGRGSGRVPRKNWGSGFRERRRRLRQRGWAGRSLRDRAHPRLALTLAGAGRGPGPCRATAAARGQRRPTCRTWRRLGRLRRLLLPLRPPPSRSSSSGPPPPAPLRRARPCPAAPARRRVAEPLSPDGTGPAQRAPKPHRGHGRAGPRYCCRCWLGGSYELGPGAGLRALHAASPGGLGHERGLCLPRGPDPR